MTFVTCKFCGKDEEGNYTDSCKEELVTRCACYTCNYWINQSEDPSTSVILYGVHRRIGKELPNTPDMFKGHGGTPYIIKYIDGREVKTTNLWHQGTIPDRFRHIMPDNVVSIKAMYNSSGHEAK